VLPAADGDSETTALAEPARVGAAVHVAGVAVLFAAAPEAVLDVDAVTDIDGELLADADARVVAEIDASATLCDAVAVRAAVGDGRALAAAVPVARLSLPVVVEVTERAIVPVPVALLVVDAVVVADLSRFSAVPVAAALALVDAEGDSELAAVAEADRVVELESALDAESVESSEADARKGDAVPVADGLGVDDSDADTDEVLLAQPDGVCVPDAVDDGLPESVVETVADRDGVVVPVGDREPATEIVIVADVVCEKPSAFCARRNEADCVLDATSDAETDGELE